MVDTGAAQDTHTSEARIAMAAAMQRLGNALVAHQPTDDLLTEIARWAEEAATSVEAAPERTHSLLVRREKIFGGKLPEGAAAISASAFPDCVVSGRANPMGIGARFWRDGDEAVCQVAVSRAFEGAPGRVHGGVVAALMDHLTGLVMSISGSPAFTGRLNVTYRQPTPIGRLVEGRARLVERSGRKLLVRGELREEGQLLVQGEGLFIAVDQDRFFDSET
jgi:acyl-coenzyme A thioesterase PaaI-like protein